MRALFVDARTACRSANDHRPGRASSIRRCSSAEPVAAGPCWPNPPPMLSRMPPPSGQRGTRTWFGTRASRRLRFELRSARTAARAAQARRPARAFGDGADPPGRLHSHYVVPGVAALAADRRARLELMSAGSLDASVALTLGVGVHDAVCRTGGVLGLAGGHRRGRHRSNAAHEPSRRTPALLALT